MPECHLLLVSTVQSVNMYCEQFDQHIENILCNTNSQ